MPRRAASPAVSEHEVDILGSIFGDDTETGHAQKKRKVTHDEDDLDFGGLLDAADGDATDDGEEDEAFIALKQAASFRKSSNLKGKSVKKGGGFQAMGLNANLLKAITRKGFTVPTPIQRKTIPLILDRKDVVGMARTGSGKTAAFVIPMIERLRSHSVKVGARAIILSPSRELALQTLKVVKDFGRGTDLKTVLLVGGDNLEEQFAAMTTNPDIIIAAPGRLLHLIVEMRLDLSTVKYVVFDEADRLFEMGFADQLAEVLVKLPPSRQTLLFSATLPGSLVEFARAGLSEPTLVRLDVDSKISPDLESAFFSVKGAEKEGALLHILQDVIKIPLGTPEGAPNDDDEKPHKKKKRAREVNPKEKPTEFSTIIFAATKHHVEYLAALLRHSGFAVSYVYGALDQTARLINVEDFRRGKTHILVVTDVAARGIDIPVLGYVINYDFPHAAKVWVHRVGRTARAGQRGWSYSLIRDRDVPYLLDLQLFLGRKLILGREASANPDMAKDVVVGSLARSKMSTSVEWVNKVLDESSDISALRSVAAKAEKQYFKTRTSASSESAKRAREVVISAGWMETHPMFEQEGSADMEQARSAMLATISGFKPQESIFEIGLQGRKGARFEAAEIMKTMRQKHSVRKPAVQEVSAAEDSEDEKIMEDGIADVGAVDDDDDDDDDSARIHADSGVSGELVSDPDSDSELEVTVSGTSNRNKGSFQDSEVYMSYTPSTGANHAAEERAYGVHSGNFLEAARDATMDLANDETAKSFGLPTRSQMRWDKKSGKYVNRANDEDGSKGAKMIRGESGVKIAASFQSGRFDRWRRAHRVGKMPRVGDAEKTNLVRQSTGPGGGGPRYKHKKELAPKEADKYRDDYHVRKKRVAEARENRVGRYKDGEGSRREIKGAEDIRKDRKVKEQRRLKNARPTKQSKQGR